MKDHETVWIVVCAWCKRVRIDQGPQSIRFGEWFLPSHGICPECSAKLTAKEGAKRMDMTISQPGVSVVVLEEDLETWVSSDGDTEEDNVDLYEKTKGELGEE